MNVAMGGVVSLLFVVMATSSVVHGVAAARPGVSTTFRAAAILGGRSGRVTWIWVAAFVGSVAAWLTFRGEVVPVSAVVVLPCAFTALATLVAEHVARVRRAKAHAYSGHGMQSNRATRTLIVRALTIVGASALAWLILDMWVEAGGI